MVFSSMIFLWVFLPVTLVMYYGLSKTGKQEMTNLLLLFMSLLFYTFGEPRYVILLLASVVINYFGGLAIAGAGKSPGKRSGAALAVTVALNLGLLGYYKYYMFASETVNRLAGQELLAVRQIALPVGISFYTFQAMSYVIDLYRGNCGVQRSFYKLLLYISFFPQLIAGPIVRYRDIEKQIDSRRVDFDQFSEGVTRFIIGLGKKVILANTFAVAVDQVFAMDASERGTLAAWYGMILYAMQIYFDFSGYSDMAIGMGKMFGFDFLENFRMPYISGSIREFWRRWHISLSVWFREYLYIPLGGSRHGMVRTCCNLFVVFLVTGIWHGAGWNFIIWGLIHGTFIILERLSGGMAGMKSGSPDSGKELPADRSGGNAFKENPWVRCLTGVLRHGYCLIVVLIAWVFFRADTPAAAFAYLGSMFRAFSGNMSLVELFGRKLVFLSGIGILLCGIVPEEVQGRIREQSWFRAFALPCVMLTSIMFLAADVYNPFIYFRF